MNNDELICYYNKEINYLLNEGKLFSKQFPSLASKLIELGNNPESGNASLNDGINRLIESFAFLTGRLQRQTENLFPEVSYNLINSIYPNLLTDVPSMTLLKFETDTKSQQKIKFKEIPSHTKLYVKSTNGTECTFETFNKFNFIPIKITKAKIVNGNEIAKSGFYLKLEMNFFGEEHDIPTEINFYTCGGNKFGIWDSIISSITKPAFIKYKNQNENELAETNLSYNYINNYANVTNSDYRHFEILKTFFTFPEMFLNFSVNINRFEEFFTLFIPINIDITNFEVSETDIGTNIIPVSNAYQKTSEPFTTELTKTEYPIISDAEKLQFEKVLSIKKIIGINPATSEPIEIQNYFNNKSLTNFYWIENYHNNYSLNKPLKYIAFVAPNGDIEKLDNEIFYSEIICTNQNEAELINSNSEFSCEISLPITNIHSLGNISEYKTISQNGNLLLQLISYLSLNYLCFSTDANNFKDNITKLLNFFSEFFANKKFTQKIDEIKITEKIRRSSNQVWISGIRGLNIDISFAYENLTSSIILTGGIIAKLLCNYVSTGQFIEVNIYQKWNLLKTFKSSNGIEVSL